MIAVVTSAQEPEGINADEPRLESWQPVFRGVAQTRGSSDDPLQVVHALKIDLETPDVAIVTTPSNGDDELETDSQTVRGFVQAYDLQAAVNASFYEPCCTYLGSEPRDILGIAVADGELVSEPQKGFEPALVEPALVVTREAGRLRARIEHVAPSEAVPVEIENAEVAVAGNRLLLEDGEIVAPERDDRHPRTAVGVSEDGTELFLMVIDGRQEGHSVGATERETAAWLARLGADDGINLDGGGSTTMVVADDGHAQVVNRPSSMGLLRSNANAIGVRAGELASTDRRGHGAREDEPDTEGADNRNDETDDRGAESDRHRQPIHPATAHGVGERAQEDQSGRSEGPRERTGRSEGPRERTGRSERAAPIDDSARCSCQVRAPTQNAPGWPTTMALTALVCAFAATRAVGTHTRIRRTRR